MFKKYYTTQMSDSARELQTRFTKIRSGITARARVMSAFTAAVIAAVGICASVVMAAVDGGTGYNIENTMATHTGSIIVSNFLVRTVPGEDIELSVDGREIVFDNAKPFVDENGRMQIPVNELPGQVDSYIRWNTSTETAIVSNGEHMVEFFGGSNTIIADGISFDMDTEAYIIDGIIYIPFRYMCEALGCTVIYTESDLPVETVTLPTPTQISSENIYEYNDVPEEYKSVFAGSEDKRGESFLYSASTYMSNEYFLEMFEGNTFDLSTGVYTANSDSFDDSVHYCYTYVLENASDEILIEYVPQEVSAIDDGIAIFINEVSDDGSVANIAYTHVGTRRHSIIKVNGLDGSKKYTLNIAPYYLEIAKPIIRVANIEQKQPFM